METSIRNFHQVTPYLFRSAQPSPEQFTELAKVGIGSIVNLRFFHSDAGYVLPAQMNYFPIPCEAFHPETEDAVKFLQTVESKNNQPLLVHCEHGSDRTGTMVAIYRIVVQGKSLGEALHEMTNGPFGFHRVFFPFIWGWFKSVDFVDLKRRAGL